MSRSVRDPETWKGRNVLTEALADEEGRALVDAIIERQTQT